MNKEEQKKDIKSVITMLEKMQISNQMAEEAERYKRALGCMLLQIRDSKSEEDIKILLQAMEITDNAFKAMMGEYGKKLGISMIESKPYQDMMKQDFKQCIRDGVGDFKEIQEKCILLDLV